MEDHGANTLPDKLFCEWFLRSFFLEVFLRDWGEINKDIGHKEEKIKRDTIYRKKKTQRDLFERTGVSIEYTYTHNIFTSYLNYAYHMT